MLVFTQSFGGKAVFWTRWRFSSCCVSTVLWNKSFPVIYNVS